MNIYLDCEFDGYNGPLLSMAMVAEDGREFYEVLDTIPVDPWAIKNVVPKLNRPAISDRTFRDKFIEFLLEFENPNICVDWYADLTYFFRWFGGKTYPDSFAYACTTEIQLIDQLHSVIPHNALEDARALHWQWPNKPPLPNARLNSYYQHLESVVSAIRTANDHAARGMLEGVVFDAVSKTVKYMDKTLSDVPNVKESIYDFIARKWNQ